MSSTVARSMELVARNFDGFRVTAGDHGLGQRQRPRPRAAIVEQGRAPGRAAQQRPVRLGIGKKSGAAKHNDVLPSVSIMAKADALFCT
jgi:hypothetical protein